MYINLHVLERGPSFRIKKKENTILALSCVYLGSEFGTKVEASKFCLWLEGNVDLPRNRHEKLMWFSCKIYDYFV